MADTTQKPFGPTGDASRHRTLEDLETGLLALPVAPKESGRVTFLMRRDADKTRVILERTILSPEEGLPDDNWGRNPDRLPDAQLAVMRHDVAELIANGQSLTLFGDSLFVDLDITAENLPTGTRIRVGKALIEVTPMPHDGCAKFNARFGNGALKFVAAKATRNQNRRGIYWRVVEAGEVAVNSTIHVIRPTQT
ncbi:MAG TPA: MOSC domain-containing protein [Verrucomicrobiae bacterium]